MIILEPEHRKYFNKFGVTKGSSIDWSKESRLPLARCTVCVRLYGDASKTDNLVLEARRGGNYLCCPSHRRKRYEG